MNIFDIQNIPTLSKNQKATVGLPSKRFFDEGNRKFVERWDGNQWLELLEVVDGELITTDWSPYDDLDWENIESQ